jgi:hypothetical protein
LNWSNQPQLLQIVALLGYIVFSGGILWFAFKSQAKQQWRWLSLLALYLVTIGFFIWVGTWFNTKLAITSDAPVAQIVEPTNRKTVPFKAPMLLRYSNIPADRYLWVVVQVPQYNQVYLWFSDELQSHSRKDGAISSEIQLGCVDCKGAIYNVVALLVDEKVNFAFQEYVKQCDSTGQCNPISLPETGVQILDFKTVFRE